jgi:uncharacterized protein YdaU (DUF1376 family)
MGAAMKYKFMPMFWGDFFANTLHLSAQELGAYTALIGHVWEHEGKIAAADAQRVARVSNFNWQKVKPRVMQFFDTLSVPNIWIHERVQSELTLAAELSSKRKAAAEQKHSKSSANSAANGLYLPSYLPIEDLNLGKGREAPTLQVHVNWRDKGVNYRSPPRAKSDNVLEPTHLVAAKRSTSEE